LHQKPLLVIGITIYQLFGSLARFDILRIYMIKKG
jgi:hypothetical protein